VSNVPTTFLNDLYISSIVSGFLPFVIDPLLLMVNLDISIDFSSSSDMVYSVGEPIFVSVFALTLPFSPVDVIYLIKSPLPINADISDGNSI